MISYEQALQHVMNSRFHTEAESVLLEDAQGRVLAEDVFADRDYPPFDRAMVDGFALRHKDIGVHRQYSIKEVIWPSMQSTHTLNEGECYKIMTGAAVPSSADVVLRKEDVVKSEGSIQLTSTDVTRFQNIAGKGEDLRKGQLVLRIGTRCNAQVIALLAALGRSTIVVSRVPTVSIVTSGDEIVNVAAEVKPLEIRNSNQYLLRSLLRSMMIEPISADHSPDNKEALLQTFIKAMEADVVISCGAVSAGDADFIPEVLNQLGVECIFHKVAIRPGKPVWFGKTNKVKVFFALPGNPFSCMSCFTLLIRPFLFGCMNIIEQPPHKLILSGSRIKRSTLDEFFPFTFDRSTGRVVAAPFNSSGDVRAGLHAIGVARHPAHITTLQENELVDCYFFNE